MNDLQLWATLVGFFLPVVVAFVQQPKWNENARAIVTFLVCVIAAGGTAYFQGVLTGRRFVSAFLFVLVAALAIYRVFWKPTGIAPKIEEVTSPKPKA